MFRTPQYLGSWGGEGNSIYIMRGDRKRKKRNLKKRKAEEMEGLVGKAEGTGSFICLFWSVMLLTCSKKVLLVGNHILFL